MHSEVMHSPTQYRTPLISDDWYYKLQTDLFERMNQMNDRFFSFTRNLKQKPFGESQKYEILVEFFVNEITGPYDQDISLLLVGNKGRGKSWCGLSMSYFTACELAERRGGVWQDYFNPDTNMAIILESEANAVMAIQEKYQVKNYDDIGIGWSARDWRDKDNQQKNDVFQINRTDNTLQIFSVPNQFLLDKVPRSLVSHYGEMAQQFFAHGFTTIKLFEPETLFREGKIIQPYLNVDRTKYVLFRIPKPPEDLAQYYKKRRKANKEKATHTRFDAVEEGDELAGNNKHGLTIKMEKAIMEYARDIIRVQQSGGDLEDICKMLRIEKKISRGKVSYWKDHIIRLFPGTS
jgi:hypothetical protein